MNELIIKDSGEIISIAESLKKGRGNSPFLSKLWVSNSRLVEALEYMDYLLFQRDGDNDKEMTDKVQMYINDILQECRRR